MKTVDFTDVGSAERYTDWLKKKQNRGQNQKDKLNTHLFLSTAKKKKCA